MSAQEPSSAPDDHEERTLLAWRRTALSLVAAGALVTHLTSEAAGAVAQATVLAGLGGVIAFAWLSPGRRAGAAGLSLVIGVGLLAGLAMLSLLA